MMYIIKDPTSDNPYLRAGFKNREAYLRQLAEDFGMTYAKVRTVAELLGCEEDFDALPCWLEDHSWIDGRIPTGYTETIEDASLFNQYFGKQA